MFSKTRAGGDLALPYGAVMATGAASALAGPAGLGFLRVPLLSLGLAAGFFIAVSPTVGHRRRRQTPKAQKTDRPAPSRMGEFSIPVGLAVLGGGLARLPGPVALGAAAFAVGAAWVATVLLGVMLLLPLVGRWPGSTSVDGAWFLVPAALLADAAGVAGLVAHSPPQAVRALGWVVFCATCVGAAGYLAVGGLAALRVALIGVGVRPLAPWWIAAGCGGLTAAAVGRASAVSPFGTSPANAHAFGWVALAFWAVAGAILLPVLAGSIRFLAGLRHPGGHPPWPPTFSTGVYALGAAQAGRLLDLAAVTTVADFAAAATLALWALTVVGRLPALRASLRVPAG